jgi:hypothetical protein
LGLELDLVGHDGGDENGDFASSLTVTEGWATLCDADRDRRKQAKVYFGAAACVGGVKVRPWLHVSARPVSHNSEGVRFAFEPSPPEPLPPKIDQNPLT